MPESARTYSLYSRKERVFMVEIFIVNKHVLIPRPETELIIDRGGFRISKNFTDKEVTILDLGTGSGSNSCYACSSYSPS